MRPNVRKKLLALAVALSLTGLGGMALAAEAPGPSLHPKGADGPSTSSDESVSASDSSDESTDDAAADDAAAEHPDNHGADVSTAAHDCPQEGHGDCVRAVAQDNAGQAADHGKAADDGADETEAPETEAPETEAPEAGGHGNGHGQGAAHGG